MKTDQSSEMKPVPCINPAAAITGNGTTTGATVDSKGFEALTFITQTGVVTDGTWIATVYAGNASNMSDEVALSLTDGSLIGAPATGAVDIAITDDNVTERVGVNMAKVAKRYYRIKFVQAAATTGGFLACVAILGGPNFSPTASP